VVSTEINVKCAIRPSILYIAPTEDRTTTRFAKDAASLSHFLARKTIEYSTGEGII
jgi:hypothetical protein